MIPLTSIPGLVGACQAVANAIHPVPGSTMLRLWIECAKTWPEFMETAVRAAEAGTLPPSTCNEALKSAIVLLLAARMQMPAETVFRVAAIFLEEVRNEVGLDMESFLLLAGATPESARKAADACAH